MRLWKAAAACLAIVCLLGCLSGCLVWKNEYDVVVTKLEGVTMDLEQARGELAKAKDFVRNKLRSAFRLIKSLEERQRTIYKVASSIVKFQQEFLDYGIERMRPLVLRDVADDIGMHESTVSRVVNDKYMHTHRGVFELRFFFHSGIASSRGGENVSSLSVKERIKKIIAAEIREPIPWNTATGSMTPVRTSAQNTPRVTRNEASPFMR